MSRLRYSLGLLVLAAQLAAPASAVAGDLAPPIRFLKQEIPTIGTNIPKRVVLTDEGDVPLNRRYDELTPEEKDVVRSRYEAMSPLDEPPYPAAGLVPLFRAISEAQRLVLAQGRLILFADVDAQGRVTAVSVVSSPDPALTRAVANVLVLTPFKPALCSGRPCAMGYPLRLRFTVGL